LQTSILGNNSDEVDMLCDLYLIRQSLENSHKIAR